MYSVDIYQNGKFVVCVRVISDASLRKKHNTNLEGVYYPTEIDLRTHYPKHEGYSIRH